MTASNQLNHEHLRAGAGKRQWSAPMVQISKLNTTQYSTTFVPAYDGGAGGVNHIYHS